MEENKKNIVSFAEFVNNQNKPVVAVQTPKAPYVASEDPVFKVLDTTANTMEFAGNFIVAIIPILFVAALIKYLVS